MRPGVTNTSLQQYSSSPGFTFIELMVVIVIISVGMFILVPRIVSGMLDRQDPTTQELNSVLKKAKEKAMKERQKIGIRFIMGGEHFFFEDKEHTMPGDEYVNRAWINEEPARGIDFIVNAYPDGVCDYFVLELSGGVKVRSIPLLCEVSVEKTEAQ